MAHKLLIVMINSDPAHGSELGEPFSQATVAAAMEYDVEVILSGLAGQLAIRGVAEKLHTHHGGQKSVYDIMREAHAAGVVFKVSSPALDLWGHDLIPEIKETVGGAYIISEAMDEDSVVFTY